MTAAGQQRWTAALDALEDHVAALHATALSGREGLSDVPRLDLPTDLGPIPPGLAPRASAVLARCRALEQDVARGMETLSRELKRLDGARPSDPSPTRMFVDQSL